jgi:hypothetical protein
MSILQMLKDVSNSGSSSSDKTKTGGTTPSGASSSSEESKDKEIEKVAEDYKKKKRRKSFLDVLEEIQQEQQSKDVTEQAEATSDTSTPEKLPLKGQTLPTATLRPWDRQSVPSLTQFPLSGQTTSDEGIAVETTVPAEALFPWKGQFISKQPQEEELKWYERGLFEDGWDFGDVTKTILGISDKKELKEFKAPETEDSLEVLKQKKDYYDGRKWLTPEQTEESLKVTQQYNDMVLYQYSKILAETQMDGLKHSVLHEIEILANMKSGKEKDERKAKVLAKMEELGMDTSFYSHFAGDGEFDWGTFGSWLKNSAMAGLNTFNKGLLDTADVLLGAPLKALGWEDNPISEGAEYYDDLYSTYRYNANLMAEKLGGNAWNFGTDTVEGTVGALPNALLMFMTGGQSATATTSNLANQAAMQTGNILTKAGLTTEAMLKNPQYWMSFARELGSEYKEAKELGASDTAAAVGSVLKSFVNSGLEIGTDGGSGIQGLSDAIKDGGKPFVEWLESSIEEGGEEILQKFVGEVINKFGYGSDQEILNPIDYAKEGSIGMLSGMALGGGQTAVQSGVNAYAEHQANKLTDIESAVKDKIVENRIAQQEKNGKTLTAKDKANIEKEVERNLRKGYLSAEEIEEAIGGESYDTFKSAKDEFFNSETYKNYKNDSKRIEKLEKQLEEADGQPNTVGNAKRYENIQNRLNILKARNDKAKATLDAEAQRIMGIRGQMRTQMMETVKDSRLYESYRELERSKQKFETDVSKYTNENAKKTVQSILDSGLGDNSNQFHETVEWLAKLSEERNVTFDLTKTERLKGTKHYREGYVTNGFKTTIDGKTNITVNLDGNYLNTTVGHEITHVLEEAGAYKDLADVVKAYAIAKEGQEGYNKRLEDVKAIYGEDQATIDSEITADIIGEYLFTDYDFVHKLSTENRNVFQKIYDEIKYLFKIATADSKEARELEKVKKQFDKAWRENVKGKTATEVEIEGDVDDVQYSVSVDDKETLDFLNEQVERGEYDAETNPDGGYYVTYKSMSFWGYDEDGNAILRSPMAEYVDGKLSNAYLMPKDKSKLNWYKATETIDEKTGMPSGLLVGYKKDGAKSNSYVPASENQDMIAEDWSNLFFNLVKKIPQKNGKMKNSPVPARYNPYEHSSNSMLNDQFSAAWQRNNLVTVKMYVPRSEDNGAFRAKYSKDATGWTDWKSGIVATKINKQKDLQRRVYLSRYAAPVEIVPDSEVAQAYKEYVSGTDVKIPDNVVSPNLLKELKNAGVPIEESGKVQYSVTKDSDGRNLTTEQSEFFKDTKAKDKDGNLLTLYHGTASDFTVFDITRFGQNYNNWSEYGGGIYLTPSKKMAQYYADNAGYDTKIMELYANIRNPFNVLEPVDFDISDLVEQYNLTEWDESFIKKAGYRLIDFLQHHNENIWSYLGTHQFDGVWDMDSHGNVNQIVAYEENQVKNFDNKKPTEDVDIRYSMSKAKEEYADPFYSHMAKVVDGVKQEKLGATSVVNMLRGKGVKAEEIKWSGIEEWLDGKKSVTKAELQEFINGSMLQIEEETRGGDAINAFIDEWRRLMDYDLSTEDVVVDENFLSEVEGALQYAVDEGNLEQEEMDRVMALAKDVSGKPSKWDDYKLDGGSNYRELVFKMPNSEYSNESMRMHWGEDAEGVLAHARMQDFETPNGKMLFIEEIQSDWHNEGHKSGYKTDADKANAEEQIQALDSQYAEISKELDALEKEHDVFLERYWAEDVPDADYTKEVTRYINKTNELRSEQEQIRRKINELADANSATVPDAPFRNNYHEYVLKRLIREAAENGYDSIGWTTADIQSKRWSDEYAEGYRIEYDQDIPKFLNKYGKKWGAQVGKTDIQTKHLTLAQEMDLSVIADILEDGESYIRKERGIESVWTMPITDAMKQSVLYEGQTQYSITKDSNGRELSTEQQKFFRDTKIVDENGNLIPMYHGTKRGGFTVFDGGKDYWYFTNDKKYADTFEGRDQNGEFYPSVQKGIDEGYFNPQNYEVYLNVTNPFVTDDMDVIEDALYWNKSLPSKLREQGYDALMLEDMSQVIVLNQNQIKHVDNATPTTDSDIRYSMSKEVPLEKRLSGDALLDAEDLISAIEDVAEIDSNGYVNVYHRTTEENAKRILQSGKMSAKEDGIFFSTQRDGEYSADYGKGVVTLRVPVEKFILDDIFDTEAHLRIPLKSRREVLDISKYIVPDSAQSSISKGGKNNSGDWHIDGDFGYTEDFADFAPVREDATTSKTETVADNMKATDEAPIKDTPVMDAPIREDAPKKTKKNFDGVRTSTQKRLKKIERIREASIKKIDEQIASARAELLNETANDSKKAKRLENRIERLERQKIESEASFDRTVQRIIKNDQHTALWEGLIGDTTKWRDMPTGLHYQTKTLRRILRKVVRDASGNPDIKRADAIYDELETKYDHNEALLKRESAKLKEGFQKLNLNHAEDEYAQMLGELRYNPETTLTEDVVKEYLKKHKGRINEAKVNKAITESRKLYDDLLIRVNEVLREQGFKEIPYRKGYFPHFSNPKQNWFQKMMNWKVIDNEIPTSIAGLTEMFKPNRSWQSFNKQRTGDKTDYSLYQGLDTYIHGALDWIYHIDDLQSRRALENLIRYTHSDKGVQEKIDAIRASHLDAEEAQKQIDAVLEEASNPLSGLVRELMNRTNTLANKKAYGDRVWENKVNRKVYSTMTNLNNRITSNQVVGSLSSAMTNFIPMVQSWHQVSPVYTLVGLGDLVRSTIKDDGMVAKSDFLTNRLMEEEKLYQTFWDKASDKAAFMMNIADHITSQTVWRSKYYQNIREGMSETQSIRDADQFCKNLMAGRSRGNAPSIFDEKNPVTKIFTAFQLEVANQYGYMFDDVPKDSKNVVRLVKGYATAFFGAYMYNALYSSLVGRDAAFDPIKIMEELMSGLLDDEEENEDVLMDFGEDVLEQMPYIGGLLGGGRIPISSAIPYFGYNTPFLSMIEDAKAGWEESGLRFWEDSYKPLVKEMLKPLYYIAMPTAGGQIKKTNEGIAMFSDEHPMPGSYTASGNLRFPVEDTFGSRVQAALFGQYSSDNARKYFDEERSVLYPDQIEIFKNLDMPIEEYWEYQDNYNSFKETKEELKDIANSNLATDEDILKSKYASAIYSDLYDLYDEQKAIANGDGNPLSKKTKIKAIQDQMSEMLDSAQSDLDDMYINGYYATIGDKRFDYNDYNHKWYEISGEYLEKEQKTIERFGVTPDEYWNNQDKYYHANNYFETKYEDKSHLLNVSKVVFDGKWFADYASHVSQIRGEDLNNDGKTDTNSKKKNVFAYIDSLNVSDIEKKILRKMSYPSEKTYNEEIVGYIVNLNTSSEAKRKALESLNYKVDAEGYVSW